MICSHVVVKIGTESYHDRALVGGIVDFDPTTIKWLVSRYSQCLAASFSWTENRLACLFPIIKVRRTFPVAQQEMMCYVISVFFFARICVQLNPCCYYQNICIQITCISDSNKFLRYSQKKKNKFLRRGCRYT